MSEKQSIILNIDDVEYTTFSTPSYDKKQKWTHPDERVITSIIPGTIVEIFVKVGDKVNEGDPMLIIEAMKMNNRINFGMSGVVGEINVKPGDIVSKGHVLIIMK
jgi:biotin carboxyl carrier protein